MISKKVITVLAFVLLFTFITPVSIHAKIPGELVSANNMGSDGKDNPSDSSKKKCSEATVGTDPNEKLEKFKDDIASIGESYIAGVVLNITRIGSGNSISTIIFGNPYCEWSNVDSDDSLIYGIFSDDEMNKIIKPATGMFSGTYVLFLALSIMLSSLKLSLRASSSKNVIEFSEDAKMWIGSALFMALLWPFINQIFILNDAFINTFLDLMESEGLNKDKFSMVSEGDYQSTTDVMLHLSEWVLTLIINFIYIARKIILMLLVIFSPLSAISLLFTTTRKYFGVWIKAFISIVFIGSLHSIIFYLFLMSSQVVVQIDSYLYKFGMMVMIIPLTTMAVSWIGLDNSSAQVGQSSIKTAGDGVKKATKGISSLMASKKKLGKGK